MTKNKDKNKAKKQENYFDLHENYESVEELELEMSKIIDAIHGVIDACDGCHLPPSIQLGIVQGAMDTYFYSIHEDISNKLRTPSLFDIMREVLDE